MRRRPLFLFLPVAIAACGGEPPAEDPGWILAPTLEPQTSGTDVLLIAVSPVDDTTVWVSGTGGTWGRTTDGGTTWQTGVVPGADSLQFRDVHAVSARMAYLLSIGNGPASRIYRTDDAGATWTLQFTNTDPNAFFDCFDFWDADHGIAFSDSHAGQFTIIETRDGGRTWSPIPPEQLPPANAGEGGFASSGTCLVTYGDSTAWIGTGASEAGPRVLMTSDRGRTWTVRPAPLPAGSGAGITTLAFRDAESGIVVGGDIGRPDVYTENVAVSGDGGASWVRATRTAFLGAAYGVSTLPGAPAPAWVAVGPGGLAVTVDNAASWMAIDTLNHWGVGFTAPDAGWAVGPEGRITRIRIFHRSVR